MGASLNKAQIIGHLGGDPELRTLPGGSEVCEFRVATDESYIDGQGNRVDKTEWHRVVCWGKLAALCGEHCSKGMLVYVEGKIQTRSWEDKDGNKRWTTEIKAFSVQWLSRSEGQRDNRQRQDFPFNEDLPSNDDLPF